MRTFLRILAFLAIGGIIGIYSDTIRAADITAWVDPADVQWCGTSPRGMKAGTWVNVDTYCALDASGAKKVSCRRDISHCCIKNATQGNAEPVCLQGSGGFTPALPDATGTEGIKQKALEKYPELGLENQKPLYFTPNIPIPGLFTGQKPVNSLLFSTYLAAFFVYFIGVVGILAVVMMMYGGFHYIVSAGSPERMKQGKEIINGAILGLVLALISFVLLRTINPAIISTVGVFPESVRRLLQDFETSISTAKTYGHQAITATSLSSFKDLVKKNGYDTWVKQYAVSAGTARGVTVDPYRLLAIMYIESRGNSKAHSGSDTYGLMQLLPSTAGPSYVAQPSLLYDPETNIKEGANFFALILKNTCPDYTDALVAKLHCGPYTEATNPCKSTDIKFANAAYNAGVGTNYCSHRCSGTTTVWDCQLNSGFEQTRNYVVDAEEAYQWLSKSGIY